MSFQTAQSREKPLRRTVLFVRVEGWSHWSSNRIVNDVVRREAGSWHGVVRFGLLAGLF